MLCPLVLISLVRFISGVGASVSIVEHQPAEIAVSAGGMERDDGTARWYAGWHDAEAFADAFGEAMFALCAFGAVAVCWRLFSTWRQAGDVTRSKKEMKVVGVPPRVSNPSLKPVNSATGTAGLTHRRGGSAGGPQMTKSAKAAPTSLDESMPAPRRTFDGSEMVTSETTDAAFGGAKRATRPPSQRGHSAFGSRTSTATRHSVEAGNWATGASGNYLERATPSQALLTVLRNCAARRTFREALHAFDQMADQIGAGCGSTWSLLLYSAVEVGDFRRCRDFFSRLCSFSAPSKHDFVNMVRYFVHTRDLDHLVQMLKVVCNESPEIDVIARNRALAVCTSHHALDLAEAIVMNMPSLPMDVVAINTLMKGYMHISRPARVFELYDQMMTQNIEPSETTFGILLDACINAKQFDRVRSVFNDLKKRGVSPNVVHATTFIKGLVSAGHLSDAMHMLEEMSNTMDVKPDLVTYTTLMKAHADSGNVMEAVQVLEQMLSQGVFPDSIVYNILLTGCCVKPMDAMQVHWIVDRLERSGGFHVSNTTLSILVKVFAKSESWEPALMLLEEAHDRFGVWPEPRIFAQLAQACSNSGCAKVAIQTYAAMVESAGMRGVPVDRAANNRVLRLCVQCGEVLRASAIFDAVARAGGRPDPSTIREIMKE